MSRFSYQFLENGVEHFIDQRTKIYHVQKMPAVEIENMTVTEKVYFDDGRGTAYRAPTDKVNLIASNYYFPQMMGRAWGE